MGLNCSQSTSLSALASLSPSLASFLYSCWRRCFSKDSMGIGFAVLIFKLNGRRETTSYSEISLCILLFLD